jgi:2-dehydropantoate 2-reductase
MRKQREAGEQQMKEIENVLIAGAGAVGCAVGSIIHSRAPGSVSVLADGERLERYRRDGFIVNGVRHDYPLVLPANTAATKEQVVDLVIVAVKHHHLEATIDALRGHVGPETTILSLLNGIQSEETFGAAFGAGAGAPNDSSIPPYAMILGIDAVRVGNDIKFASGGKIFFGESRNQTGAWSERVARLARFFDRTGVAYVIPENMLQTLWYKFMINVGINQLSAVLRAPYGIFQRLEEAREAMEAPMREVIALSHAAGIGLENSDLHRWHETLSALHPGGLTSMCQDVLAKRKTEVEMFAGTVVALGKKHGVPTPANEMLFDLLRVIESSY